MSKSKLPMWIDDSGLNFSCTGCGKCCAHEPGFVFLTNDDVERLTKHLKITKQKFLKRYCRKVGHRYSLLEEKNYDCIFFKDKSCTIYNARPKQCRTYPFWDEVIASKSSWKKEQKHCEGINHKDATKMSKEQILLQKEQA